MALDVQQVNHISRLALLAMCARGVASSEFDGDPQITQIRVVVYRDGGVSEYPVDVEFIGLLDMPVAGMSL